MDSSAAMSIECSITLAMDIAALESTQEEADTRVILHSMDIAALESTQEEADSWVILHSMDIAALESTQEEADSRVILHLSAAFNGHCCTGVHSGGG